MLLYPADVTKKKRFRIITFITIATSTARITLIARKVPFEIILSINASRLTPFIAVKTGLEDDLLELLQAQLKPKMSFSGSVLTSQKCFFWFTQTTGATNYVVGAEGTLTWAITFSASGLFFFVFTLHVLSYTPVLRGSHPDFECPPRHPWGGTLKKLNIDRRTQG
jgi:hypothetical protein